jgi:hypothetical protein
MERVYMMYNFLYFICSIDTCTQANNIFQSIIMSQCDQLSTCTGPIYSGVPMIAESMIEWINGCMHAWYYLHLFTGYFYCTITILSLFKQCVSCGVIYLICALFLSVYEWEDRWSERHRAWWWVYGNGKGKL